MRKFIIALVALLVLALSGSAFKVEVLAVQPAVAGISDGAWAQPAIARPAGISDGAWAVKPVRAGPNDAYYCPGPGAHYWQRAGPWVYYLECRPAERVCDFWIVCYTVWRWQVVAQYYDPSGYYG